MIDFPSEEAEMMWLAGICDCDSAMCLEKSVHKTCRRGFCWLLFVKISQKNPALIEQLKYSFPDGNKYFAHHRSTWSYTMYANQLRIILPKLLFYLTNKKDQAILLLEALALLSQHHGYYTPNDERLEEIFIEIRNLHNKWSG